MRRPALFVSSTCYDLKQVRSDVKQFIESLGMEPLLSEYDSFPVNPDVAPVDNCIGVVESRADIFVLIIGSRYGSVADDDKSITNLEYLAAKAKGLPIYVFVSGQMLDILPVWKANRAGDFSSVCDSAKLFEFVESLRDAGERWVFPFACADDIFRSLRKQLPYLFMEGLDLRRRANTSGALQPRFRDLRGDLLRLLIERPCAWEYLLFSEALTEEVKKLADLKRDWQYGITTRPGLTMSPSEFIKWVKCKGTEAQVIIANAAKIVNEALPIAFGPPGVSGDPEAILHAARRLARCYQEALEWRLDFGRIEVPEEMSRVKALSSSLCDNMVPEIEEFSSSLNAMLKQAIQDIRAGRRATVEIVLKPTIPDVSALGRELERLTPLILSGQLKWE